MRGVICELGSPRSDKPSAAGNPHHCGRGAGSSVPGFRGDVFDRPPVDPAGEAAACPVVAGFTRYARSASCMEQMDYNLLFRWFVGLSMDAPIWDVTVFTKNRERLSADGADGGDTDGSGSGAEGKQPPKPKGATPRAISTARSVATQPTHRPPTRTPGFIRRAAVSRPNFAIWAMSLWKIAMAWLSTPR